MDEPALHVAWGWVARAIRMAVVIKSRSVAQCSRAQQLNSAREFQAPLRGSGSSEKVEKFRGNDLRIVQGNKVSRVDHDDLGVRNQGGGPLRELFRHGFVVRALKK